MFKVKFLISNVDYSEYVVYPLTFSEKNIDDSLNIYDVALKHVPLSEPFKPHQWATIELYEDGVSKNRYFLSVLGDAVQKVGKKDLYNHTITLVEYIQQFENTILPDMTITRVRPTPGDPQSFSYLPTLKDAAEKVLFIAGLDRITFDPTTEAILDSIDSPEWSFTRRTVLEALRLIFAVAKITPTLVNPITLGHVGVEGTETQSVINNFAALESAYDPQTYRSAIHSNIEFMRVREDFETVVEPANGWITTRPNNQARITNDNAIIKTNRPIDQVQDLKFRFLVYYEPEQILIDGSAASARAYYFDSDKLNPDWFINFADFVYEESAYDVLPDTIQVNFDSSTGKFESGKGSSLFFTQGKNDLYGLGGIAPSRFSGLPNRQAILELLENFTALPPEVPFPGLPNVLIAGPFIRSQYIQDFLDYVLDSIKSIEGTNDIQLISPPDLPTHKIRMIPYEDNKHFTSTAPLSGLDLQFSWVTADIQTRVEYRPYINTNITSFSPVQEADASDEITNVQYYNQQSNDVESKALADLHEKVITRGRGKSEMYTLLNKNYDELINLGKKIDNFVVSSANHVVNKNHIISDYNLTEGFAKLNKYTAVLERYRQFSIPQENIVKRQFTKNIFAKFETQEFESDFAENLLVTDYRQTDPAYVLEFTPENDPNNIQYFPTTHFPFNNQIIFEVEFPTNTKTGDSSEPFFEESFNEDGDGEYDQGDIDPFSRIGRPVTYIDENGFLENAQVRLVNNMRSSNLSNWELEESHDLPKRILGSGTPIFYEENVSIKKDPREQLRFTVVIHHIENTQNGHFTNLWASENGLVNPNGGLRTGNIDLAFLSIPLDSKIDTISNSDIVQNFDIASFSTSNSSILLPQETLTEDTNAVLSWAIVRQSDKKVMYWYDEPIDVGSQNSQIYINFYDEYISTPEYDVVFKDYDGTTLKIEKVKIWGDAVPPPDPVRVPWNFIGWDTDFTLVVEDLVVNAVYELPPIDVSPLVINLDAAASGAITAISATGTASDTINLDSVATGQKNKIETASKVVGLTTSTQGEITFLFIERNASGTINLLSSAAGEKNKEEDAFVTVSTILAADGELTFKFLEGDASGTVGVIGSGDGEQTQVFLEGDAAPLVISTLVSADGDPEEVTATFNSAGGSPTFSSITGVPPLSVSSPGTPSRTGYTFAGWSPSLPRTISTDTTFTAQWTPITYSISYVMNGGTNNPSNPTSYNITTPTINLLDPTRSGYFFTGWSPTDTIPQGSTGNKTFTASWTAQNPLNGPTLQSGPTVSDTTTISFTLRHNNSNNVNLRGFLYTSGGSQWTSQTIGDVPPNSDRTFTFTNLPFDTQFFARGQSLARVFPDVNSAIIDYNASATTDPQPQTATPTTATSNATQTTVAFTITNNDSLSGTAEWEIREGSSTGPIVASSGGQFIGPSSNSSTRTITVEATGLDPDTLYYLNNVYVTVSGKTKSNKGSIRFLATDPIPQTATPTTATGSTTETSVSFTLKNNDGTSGVAEWQIREGSTSGTIVASASSVSIGASGAANDTITASASGLNPSTTYWFTQTFVTASGKLKSNMGTSRSLTTDTPPPTYDIRAKLESTTFAITSVDHTLEGSPGSTSLNTSGFTTIYSNVDQNDFFTITAPDSFTYNGTTFTFANWEVNGDGQGSNNTYTTNVSEDIDAIAVYGAFGGF